MKLIASYINRGEANIVQRRHSRKEETVTGKRHRDARSTCARRLGALEGGQGLREVRAPRVSVSLFVEDLRPSRDRFEWAIFAASVGRILVAWQMKVCTRGIFGRRLALKLFGWGILENLPFARAEDPRSSVGRLNILARGGDKAEDGSAFATSRHRTSFAGGRRLKDYLARRSRFSVAKRL